MTDETKKTNEMNGAETVEPQKPIIQYPILVTIQVMVINVKTKQSGMADFRVPVFTLPTDKGMQSILTEGLTAMPQGYRIMTQQEAHTYVMRQKTGNPNVVSTGDLPEGQEWHVDGTDSTKH